MAAREIMLSIKISDKLKIAEFKPYQVQGPQPVGNDMQLEAIKKIKKNRK